MTRHDPHAREGTNRDFGARQYENLPSITDRQAGESRRDDSFGPPELGGPLDAHRAGDRLASAEGRSLGESTQRAIRRGRGPKNATRSDSLIAEELNERFMDDDLLDASEILLRVENGHVLLTGEVPERWMKHRAEDIADSVRGVADVENLIRVDNGEASFGTGGAVRSGLNQPGSGFSSPQTREDRKAPDDRVD